MCPRSAKSGRSIDRKGCPVHGLALESAGHSASAALWRCAKGASGSTVITACLELSPDQGRADQLILLVERLLGEQGLSYQDLDVIAVNRGPGSFVGIRSAVALGRGLALAAKRPVLGVTSMEAIAAMIAPNDQARSTLVAADARRDEVYRQAFDAAGRPLDEIRAQSPEQAAARLRTGRWRLAGSGAPLVLAALGGQGDVVMTETAAPDARAVAGAAAERLAAGQTPVSGFELRPLYVRPPDAALPTPLVTPAGQAAGAAV